MVDLNNRYMDRYQRRGMGSLGHKSKRGCMGTFPELIAKVKVSADMVLADASIIRDKAIYRRPHGVKHHTA